MIRRFEAHKSAQCYIKEYDNGNKVLVSYRTEVVIIEENWVEVTGLYSMTTRRHIGWFMAEIGETYQFAKTLYENHVKFNLVTGEVQPIG